MTPSTLPHWVSMEALVPVVLAFGLGWALAAKFNYPLKKYPASPAVAAVATEGDASVAAPTVEADAPAVAAAEPVDAGPVLGVDGAVLDPSPVTATHLEPTSPDPRGGRFTLAQATEGLEGTGALVADIVTSMGTFSCTLLSTEAPNTVANFVGLARGKRDFWDPVAGAWARRPFYEGSIFHRVIPDFMVQGGDLLRSGSGGTGYEFADENVQGHNAAGLLCMANHGANTNGGQFFITETAKPHLDGTYSIFGRCTPTELVNRITRLPRDDNDRPRTPVFIQRVTVRRGTAR
jgi:peptidyl-prolyl cis-trans isomerase A (cyclophilin A)